MVVTASYCSNCVVTTRDEAEQLFNAHSCKTCILKPKQPKKHTKKKKHHKKKHSKKFHKHRHKIKNNKPK